MRTGTTILFSLALCCVTPVLAQLPRKPAPAGMMEVATGGNGRILTSRMGGSRSARKMLVALKMVAREYFDGPMTVTRAFADRADRNLQASFTARLKGVPVRGVAAVAMAGEGGQGTLLFDNAKTFSQSFRTLVAKQNSGGGGKAALVKLTRQQAPDGSCEISLPPGYRITSAYKGSIDVAGPNGAAMALGMPVVCTRPEAAAWFPGTPAVSFEDPVQAMVDYVNHMSRQLGQQIQATIHDTKPIPDWQSGKAVFMRYTVKVGGNTTEGFGLFAIMPTDVNQAMLYQSYINASPQTYRKQFPEMLQAWGTWSINPAVFSERLMAAAQSMRGISDIIQSAHTTQQQSNARINEAWSDYIRDQGTWANPTTGSRYKIPNTATNAGGIPMQNGTALVPVPLSGL